MLLVNIIIVVSMFVSLGASIFAIIGIVSGMLGRNIAIDMIDDLEDKLVLYRESKRKKRLVAQESHSVCNRETTECTLMDEIEKDDDGIVDEIVVEERPSERLEGDVEMSEFLKQNITFACTKCNNDIETDICTNVNSKDHDSVKQIIEGKFFLRTCEKCGKVNVVAFPVCYKDVDKNRFIFFLPINSTSKLEEPQISENSRITHDMVDFIEKVRIMQMGLDDKIIEIVKVAALNQVVRDGKLPADNLTSIGCWVHDDRSMDFDLRCDGKQYILQATHKMYQDIEEEFDEILKQYKEPKVVDLNWAMMVLNSLTIESEQTDQSVNDDDWDEIVFD